METESFEHRPDLPASAGATPRKRNCLRSEADSDDTELYSPSSDTTSDDEGFEVYTRRKAKRRNVSGCSASSKSTVIPTPRAPEHTIIFVPEAATDNLNRLNRQAISIYLESLAPGEIKDVRINNRKNVLAIDVTNRSALDPLMKITQLDNIKVRCHTPQTLETTAGVVYNIDVSICDSDLPILIKTTTESIPIIQAHRIGKSTCVKLIFKGDSLPTYVKVGHFRHIVRPFVPKPLQCRNCQRIGHVSAVCKNPGICSRCSESHSSDTCRTTDFKCSNCKGAHDATSKDCPFQKNEQKILRQMVRDHSTHKEAATKVRRRRRRSRHRKSRKHCDSSKEVHTPEKAVRQPLTSCVTNADERRTPAIDNSKEAWPPLPKPCQLAEPRDTSRPTTTNGPTAGPAAVRAEGQDLQVIAMLKSLMNVMRTLLTNLNTPNARSALQVLDAMNPVLASLE
ncbi:uncharacterized protein LOC125947003 [Dermacentor silvarum]|uniref:uncharacterized protein LOC125947003 n=1 Tax=Dermacentor silvarum TaxID=543639 RepID=UPI002101C4C0|nr:uncharacterized protein LOC125947003 [Dermacentor silvarum]